MWVVGSLATARQGWDRSRPTHPPTSTPFTSLTRTPPHPPKGGVLPASVQYFGSVPISGRAPRDTRDEYVDLQRRESGASARLRKKKLSGINKQTDRLGEHRKESHCCLPARCLYPCYILPIHLFKSPSPHTLTACLTTFSFESPLWV